MQKEESFGARLKELRLKSKYVSQDELADAVGIARQTLGNYENNSRNPDSEVIKRLAKTLEVSADYLLGLSHVSAPNETVQGIHKKTGLSQEAIRHLSVNNALSNNYVILLSDLIAHASFPMFIQIIESYLTVDEYWDGCTDLFPSSHDMMMCLMSTLHGRPSIRKSQKNIFGRLLMSAEKGRNAHGTKDHPQRPGSREHPAAGRRDMGGPVYGGPRPRNGEADQKVGLWHYPEGGPPKALPGHRRP